MRVPPDDAVKRVGAVAARVGAGLVLLVRKLPVGCLIEAELQPATTVVGETHQVAGDCGLYGPVAQIQPTLQFDIECLPRLAQEIAETVWLQLTFHRGRA